MIRSFVLRGRRRAASTRATGMSQKGNRNRRECHEGLAGRRIMEVRLRDAVMGGMALCRCGLMAVSCLEGIGGCEMRWHASARQAAIGEVSCLVDVVVV
jgi:hypothetical protein